MLRQLKEAVFDSKKILLSDLANMLDLRTIRNESDFIKKIPEDFYCYFDMITLDYSNGGVARHAFVINTKDIYKVIPVFIGCRTKAFDFFSEEEASLIQKFIKDLMEIIHRNNNSIKINTHGSLCLNKKNMVVN